jgi:hypothetical protein
MADRLAFDGIVLNNVGWGGRRARMGVAAHWPPWQGAVGTLKLAPDGLGWKPREGADKIVAVPTNEVKGLRWLRAAHGHRCRVQLQNGSALRLDGFEEGVRAVLHAAAAGA